ncbi:hypothetical protein E4U30_004901 [Claviceps sp. LM220 group G6]|nr:hypothetical protein E4U30_004901 [Claviceps sp. LM220 group G6]
MAAAGITGSGGIKNARYIRHQDMRGKNNDQVSVDPRAKTGRHDLVKSRPGSRGGGSGCDVGEATRLIGATTTETDIQSETATATGSATVTASVTTGCPVTDFSGQGLAGVKIAVRNAPRHPPSTSLKDSIAPQPVDDYETTYTPVSILATAPASPAAASSGGNRISTAVAITIGLATAAGLALLFAALVFWRVCRRRRRSGRLGSTLQSQGEPANRSRKSALVIPASSVSISLADLPPAFSCPSRSSALPVPPAHLSRSAGCGTVQYAPPPFAPARLARPSASPSGLSFSDGQGGASSWWKNCGDRDRHITGMDEVKRCNTTNNRPSTPPPRLIERRLHPSISNRHNFSGSPLSTPVLKETRPSPHRHGGHVRGRHMPITTSNENWQRPISLTASAHPPVRTFVSEIKTSSISATQTSTNSGITSPLRTPIKITSPGPIWGSQSPGPPPHGPLPLPPLKFRHIGSLPPEKTVNTEEVGLAASGPSNLGITIDKPYYQVWCEASRWQPPPSFTPEKGLFF